MPVKIEIPAVLLSVTSLVCGSETALLFLVSEGYLFSSACWPEQRVHVGHEHFKYMTNSILHGSYFSFAMKTSDKAYMNRDKAEGVGEGAEEWVEWRTQEME